MRVSIGSPPPRCAAPSTKDGRQLDVRRWLERHSTTGVPQPLAYLIDDVARRHDSIRVGPAGSYVRLSDQAQAAALLAHPAAAALGLRAVAPGVLVASVDEHELLPLLQELGHAPAIENGAGEVIGTPPTRRATGHVAKQQDIPSAAEVADALLARERRQQVHAESSAGPTKQARWSLICPTDASQIHRMSGCVPSRSGE